MQRKNQLYAPADLPTRKAIPHRPGGSSNRTEKPFPCSESNCGHPVSRIYILAHIIHPCRRNLGPSVCLITFKRSVPVSRITQAVSIITFNQITLFRAAVCIYSQNHTQHVLLLWEQNVKFWMIKPLVHT